jgi:hypothetical protein
MSATPHDYRAKIDRVTMYYHSNNKRHMLQQREHGLANVNALSIAFDQILESPVYNRPSQSRSRPIQLFCSLVMDSSSKPIGTFTNRQCIFMLNRLEVSLMILRMVLARDLLVS